MTDTRNDRRSLMKATSLIELFRSVSPEMPSQMIQAFLIVCRAEGCSINDVADRLGMPKSSASRNISALSKVHRLGKPGFDLLDTRDDPMDRRVKKIHLTPAGKALKARIIDLLEE